MRLISPLLAASGVALFGSAAVLQALDAYLALEIQRFLPRRHAADRTGGFAPTPAKPPAAGP